MDTPRHLSGGVSCAARRAAPGVRTPNAVMFFRPAEYGTRSEMFPRATTAVARARQARRSDRRRFSPAISHGQALNEPEGLQCLVDRKRLSRPGAHGGPRF